MDCNKPVTMNMDILFRKTVSQKKWFESAKLRALCALIFTCFVPYVLYF